MKIIFFLGLFFLTQSCNDQRDISNRSNLKQNTLHPINPKKADSNFIKTKTIHVFYQNGELYNIIDDTILINFKSQRDEFIKLHSIEDEPFNVIVNSYEVFKEIPQDEKLKLYNLLTGYGSKTVSFKTIDRKIFFYQ